MQRETLRIVLQAVTMAAAVVAIVRANKALRRSMPAVAPPADPDAYWKGYADRVEDSQTSM